MPTIIVLLKDALHNDYRLRQVLFDFEVNDSLTQELLLLVVPRFLALFKYGSEVQFFRIQEERSPTD